MKWRKSSFSNGSGGSNCVEVARDDEGNYLLRHSKDPNGGTLVYTPDEWHAFVAGVQAGEFDF